MAQRLVPVDANRKDWPRLVANAINTLINTAPGTGTVTSVNASGGTTGFSFSGGPITTGGTLTLAVANAATVRSALGLGTLATQSGTFSGTSSGTNTGDQTITLTGDATGSGTGSFVATLANSGVTAATYGDSTHVAQVTVDAKGRVTGASSVAIVGPAFRGALVKKSTDLTGANLTSGSDKLAWDAEQYDTDSIHDNSTNNTRLTVPSGISYVRVSVGVFVTALTANSAVKLFILKNGAGFVGLGQQYAQSGNTDCALTATSAVIAVTAADYFEVQISINGDTSVTVSASNSWFAMEIIE